MHVDMITNGSAVQYQGTRCWYLVRHEGVRQGTTPVHAICGTGTVPGTPWYLVVLKPKR